MMIKRVGPRLTVKEQLSRDPKFKGRLLAVEKHSPYGHTLRLSDIRGKSDKEIASWGNYVDQSLRFGQYLGEVLEIIRDKKVLLRSPKKGVKLGDPELEGRLNYLLHRCRRNTGRIFFLRWKGSKIPRGAKVLGHEIAWAQHGRVVKKDGEGIGTYERTMEFAGESGLMQEMIVYLFPRFSESRN
jgi:hypothetical protein